jgi:hypothetical protein
MKRYLYPRDLKAVTRMWLWGLRDFTILGIAAMLSVFALVKLGTMIPAALTLCFGFLTVRLEETTILDFIRWAARYLISTQQYYEWR